MKLNLLPSTRIPVPQLRDVPAVAESEAIGIRIATNLEAAKAEVRRIDALKRGQVDDNGRAARIAAGEIPEPPVNLENKRATAVAVVKENDLAREIHTKNHSELLRREGGTIRKAPKVACDVEVKRMANALADVVFPVLCALERVKNDLGSQGLGWYGDPISVDLDTFGSPFDITSPINILLRDFASKGYLSRMPEALR